MTSSLVTGGAGFIGSNLVDYLLDRGHQVVCVDNESAECNDKFYWNPKAINVKGDVTDYKFMKNVFTGVDYVFILLLKLGCNQQLRILLKQYIRTV